MSRLLKDSARRPSGGGSCTPLWWWLPPPQLARLHKRLRHLTAARQIAVLLHQLPALLIDAVVVAELGQPARVGHHPRRRLPARVRPDVVPHQARVRRPGSHGGDEGRRDSLSVRAAPHLPPSAVWRLWPARGRTCFFCSRARLASRCRTHFKATDFRVEMDTSAETGIEDWNCEPRANNVLSASSLPSQLPSLAGATALGHIPDVCTCVHARG